MPDMGERMARAEQMLVELTNESAKSRRRLHDLEGVTGILVAVAKERDKTLAQASRRLEVRLQVMTVVVAVAALVVSALMLTFHYSH